MSIINYKQYTQLKSRNDFIDNLDDDGESIKFLPISVYDSNYYHDYKIILIGIKQTGEKIVVEIRGIKPYFEIILDDDMDIESVCEMIECNDYEIFEAKQFKGYQKKLNKFMRVKFNSMDKRNKALKVMQDSKFHTTTDERNNYYRVVCRDYQTTFASWVNITSYKKIEGYKINAYSCKIKNYNKLTQEEISKNDKLKRDKTLVCSWDIETCSPKNTGVPDHKDPKSKIISICLSYQWLHDTKPIYQVCICILPANNSLDEKEIIYDDELSEEEIEESEKSDEENNEELETAIMNISEYKDTIDFVTVICKNELNILKVFTRTLSMMNPDLIVGFNDSLYDWPWVINRSLYYGSEILSDMIKTIDIRENLVISKDKLKGFYSVKKIKIDASNDVEATFLNLYNYIPIDVRICLRKIKNEEQSSLKYYLDKYKLSSKADMPYEKMFRIFREFISFIKENRSYVNEKESIIKFKSKNILEYEDWNYNNKSEEKLSSTYKRLKKEATEINVYCLIDSVRCHQLLKKSSSVIDYREVSNMAYMGFADSVYLANGVKVRNLCTAIGQKHPYNIRFTSKLPEIEREEAKYPGAKVFDPEKNLYTSKLSMRERKEKFPSKWEELDIEYYENLIKEDKLELEKNLPVPVRDFYLEKTKRPVTALDFASLYPSLIMCYNLSADCVIVDELKESSNNFEHVEFIYNNKERKANFIKHENILDINSPNYKFGLYGYILNDLFQKRALVKKQLKEIDEKLEHMDSNNIEYDDLIFNRNYLNSKQNALKVFMNTFYGETGNKNSPFFILEIAGSITELGKKSIILAHTFVTKNNWHVIYGDTDSLYLSAPEDKFKELDRLYYSNQISKLDYWTEMVKITMVEIDDMRNKVNDLFYKTTGNKFLKMAYEEVLFPMLSAGKKKYTGIAHETVVNFKPKKLFVKGLELVKRGISDILKDSNMEILWRAFDINNIYTMLELVQIKIDEIYLSKIHIDKFIQTGIYKPEKKNIPMQTFYARQKERGIELTPFERFKYVIVKKYPWTYDVTGKKSDIKKGDRIETLEYTIANNLEIDIDFYMKSSILGSFARFITHEDVIVRQLDPISEKTPDEIKKEIEKKSFKLATSYVKIYCEKYFTKYRDVGVYKKQVYKSVNNQLIGNDYQIVNGVFKSNNIKSVYCDDDPEKKPDEIKKELIKKEFIKKEFIKNIVNISEKEAKKFLKRNYAKNYLESCTDVFFNKMKCISQLSDEENEETTKSKKKIKVSAKQKKEFYNYMKEIYYGSCSNSCRPDKLCGKNEICKRKIRLSNDCNEIIARLRINKVKSINYSYKEVVEEKVGKYLKIVMPENIKDPVIGELKDEKVIIPEIKIEPEEKFYYETKSIIDFQYLYFKLIVTKLNIIKLDTVREELVKVAKSKTKIPKLIKAPVEQKSGSDMLSDINLN